MIDHLKILVLNKSLIEKFNTDPRLIWHDKQEKLSHYDFEVIQSKETKAYNGILFCFYESKLEVLFRPHYYFNENEHNANDFSAWECIKTLNSVIEDFNLLAEEIEQLLIINIEFGINVISPIDCKDLITFLSYHQRNEFKNDPGLAYSKKSYKETRSGTANKYKIIKAYHKALQFPDYCNKNTFRFEIKSKQSKYIKKLNIHSLGSLLLHSIYQGLAEEIKKEWREVLILGNNSTYNGLTESENKQINKYLNPHNWYKIKQGNRNLFSKTKNRYYKLLNKTGSNIHQDMEKIIDEKLHQILNRGAHSTPQPICVKGANSTISIIRNCTPLSKKKCPITGLSLEQEKEGAFYIRTSTLKYLFKNDKELFQQLKIDLLANSYKSPKFEKDEIKHMAKQIRNRFFNPIQIRQIGYRQPIAQNQLSIF